MAFDWREYLALAAFLQDPGSTFSVSGTAPFSEEAALRSAVSRAYYAAFCHARAYARQTLGYAPSYSARDHAAVALHLINRGRNQTANDLDQLRIWRNRCDYEDGVALLPIVTLAAIAKAREIIAALV